MDLDLDAVGQEQWCLVLIRLTALLQERIASLVRLVRDQQLHHVVMPIDFIPAREISLTSAIDLFPLSLQLTGKDGGTLLDKACDAFVCVRALPDRL